MQRGKWEKERGFHIEPRRGGIIIEMDIIFEFQPRRGDILIGWNINYNRPAPGMGAASFWGMKEGRSWVEACLAHSNRRNEPKDTADSPVNGGEAKRNRRAGAMVKGM